MQLRIGEEYVKQFGKLAQAGHDAGRAREPHRSRLHRHHGDQHREQASSRPAAPGRPQDLSDVDPSTADGPARPIRLCGVRRAGRGDDVDPGPRHRRDAAGVPDHRRARSTSPTRITASGSSPPTWRVWASGQLFWGMLSDRFGRRPVLLGGLGLYVRGRAAVRAHAAASTRCSPGASCMVWRPRA